MIFFNKKLDKYKKTPYLCETFTTKKCEFSKRK